MQIKKRLNPRELLQLKLAEDIGDGVVMTLEAQKRLNEAARAIFNTPNGDLVLTWLKGLTLNRAHVPPFSEGVLAHANGARWLVCVLDKRVKMGPITIPSEELDVLPELT